MGDFARGFTKSYDSSSIIKGIQARDKREEIAEKLKLKQEAASKLGDVVSKIDKPGASIAGGLLKEYVLEDLDDASKFIKMYNDKDSDAVAMAKAFPGIIRALQGGEDSEGLDRIIKDRDQEEVLGRDISFKPVNITDQLTADDDIGSPNNVFQRPAPPDMSALGKTRLDVSSVKVAGMSFGETTASKKMIEIKGALMLETLKNKQTAWDTLQTMKGLTQILASEWRAAAEEKGGIISGELEGLEGIKAAGEAFVAGKTGGFAEALDLPGKPHTKAYIGARIETALNMSKLITGGSRIVRDIFNNILKTLPKDNRLGEDFSAKLGQTIKTNAVRALGRNMTTKEIDAIESEIETIINTPAAATIRFDVDNVKYFVVDGQRYKVPIEEVGDFFSGLDDASFIDDVTGEVRGK